MQAIPHRGTFSAFLADGNSFADAGAKKGGNLHASDPEAELLALRAWDLVRTAAKF